MDRAVMILGQVSLGPSRVSKSVRTRNAGAKNLMITELFYSHILNMNRGSLHTRSFRGIHLSVFKYRLSKRLCRPEKFPELSRNRPLFVQLPLYRMYTSNFRDYLEL